VSLPANSLAFTFCQTPIIYTRANAAIIEVTYADDRLEAITGSRLEAAASRHIFDRDGQIQQVRVTVAG
jgi:hypothetical protein